MNKYEGKSTETLRYSSLKSEQLPKKVLLWFKNEILDGRFSAGSELPSEQELCELLGVGKSSVREALKMLEIIGVVEVQQGKRTRICQKVNSGAMMPLVFSLMLVQGTAQELYDFRVLFESAVTNYAMTHATEDGISQLAKEVDHYKLLCAENKATPTDEFAFHKKLYEICNNPYITQIGTILLDLFTGPILQYQEHDPFKNAAEHEMIVDALIKKDNALLDKAMNTSFGTYRSMLNFTK